MRQLIVILAFLPSILFARTWTDVKGRSFDGELVSCDEKQITIKRHSDQREFTIERSALGDADNKFINKKIKESKPPEGAPSFRGAFPSMTYDYIVELTKKEPLVFASYEPDRYKIRGTLFLEPNYKQIREAAPKYENYCRVAVSKGDIVYEWSTIAIEMYDGNAVSLTFGTPSRIAKQVDQWIFPWVSTMYDLLTVKYGKPDTLHKDPYKLSVLDARSGYMTYVAKWIKGDYQITLGLGKSDYRYSAKVSYTYLPLLKKQQADEAAVKGNF